MASIEQRFEDFDERGDNNISRVDFDESRFAQFAPSVAQNLFESYDANEDDVVTKEEVLTQEETNFKEMAQANPEKFTNSRLQDFLDSFCNC